MLLFTNVSVLTMTMLSVLMFSKYNVNYIHLVLGVSMLIFSTKHELVRTMGDVICEPQVRDC